MEVALSLAQPHPLAQPPALRLSKVFQTRQPINPAAARNKKSTIICCAPMFLKQPYITNCSLPQADMHADNDVHYAMHSWQ